MKKYQNNLSESSPILLNRQYKQAKVDKMHSILKDVGAFEKSSGIALDIGCSAGFFTNGLSKYFDQVIGIDIDLKALEIAEHDNQKNNIQFMIADSLNLPFPDNSMDLVLCNHVYEHVPDAEILFSEIERVLSPEGVCYLGAASRLTFIEPHYHLPFLSWLPKPIAHQYMKITGKGDEYYENLRTYFGVRKLIEKFRVTDYTLEIVDNPDKYHARDMIPKGGMVDKIPMFLWKLFYVLLPSYIFILRKKS